MIIVGTNGDNTLDGTAQGDLVFAGAGDDVINSGEGNDLVFAGSGDDTVNAGDGNDIVLAGWGDDTVNGGEGDDLLFGGCGDDELNGGAGDDWLIGGWGDDILRGDDPTSGGVPGENLLVNGSFEDTTGMTSESFGFRGDTLPGWTFTGGSTVEIVNGARPDFPDATDGALFLDTETTDGNLTVSQAVAAQAGETYTLSFSAGMWFDGDGLANNALEIRFGGELVATLDASDMPNLNEFVEFSFEVTGGMGDGSNELSFTSLDAGVANDRQTGVALDNVSLTANNPSGPAEGGDDVLIAGSGNDELYGGAGDDYLRGGNGNDINSGGSGSDIFAFDTCDGSDVITDFELGVDTIRIKGLGCGSDAFLFSTLSFTQDGDDTVIEFGWTDVRVEDTLATDFSVSDFDFV